MCIHVIFVFSLKINFMGYTSFDIPIVESILHWHNIKFVVDFGAQNNFSQPYLPAPYMREWYEAKGIRYQAIDLNAEDGCMVLDMSEPNHDKLDSLNADLLCDMGSSEHVSDDKISYGTGKFSWDHIYTCWLNKHKILKVGGIMFNENPKTGNWPGHGFNYYTQDFYRRLAQLAGYRIIMLQDHPAMMNIKDGWNVVCVMQKTAANFISLEAFKTLDLRQS